MDYLPLKKVPFLFLLLLLKKLDHQKEIHDFKVDELEIDASNDGNIDGEQYSSEHYSLKVLKNAIHIVCTSKIE